jgi:threonine/homoserine/homoserine lactone efflux protein
MLHTLSIFFFTAAISFVGSVQLGPVNLAVMKTVLEGRPRAALWIGAGVCIPEFIYSLIALLASAWLLKRETLLTVLEWGVVPLLVGMGLLNILKKKKPDHDDIKPAEKAADFGRGIIISFLNPQLLPFWLTILVMLNGYDFFRITTVADRIAFVAGTGFGEFVLILLVVWITGKFRTFLLDKLKRWDLDKLFGWLFIVLALAQSGKLLLRLFRLKK